MMIKKLCDMVERFLNGEYEPLSFSFDFPDAIIEHWDDGVKENSAVMEIFNDEFPEICADFERGADPHPFMERIATEYERAKRVL